MECELYTSSNSIFNKRILISWSDQNKKGKENAAENVTEENIEVLDSDEDVTLTPPGSPQGATPKTVRGAKMTKKTQKALEQLKTKTVIEKNSSRRSKQGKGNISL